jgi:hypothetical protein
MEEKEVNIGIKDVKRAIMSLRNGEVCDPEDICTEFLKDGTEKPNIKQHHQLIFKRISSTGSIKRSIYALHTQKRIPITIEEFR